MSENRTRQTRLFEEDQLDPSVAHETTKQSIGATASGFALVIVDIPARALSEPFAYGVPTTLKGVVSIGTCVLVPFGNRPAAGYVVELGQSLQELTGTEGLDPGRVRFISAALSDPVFSHTAPAAAQWMSQEYAAPLAECLRLFLPPGGTPRLRKDLDGSWQLVPPAIEPKQERWVYLTDHGREFEPRANAARQRQLISALACGPVTTRELRLLCPDMTSAIRSLERQGVVSVEERRAWRGNAAGTTSLSSASAQRPDQLTQGQLQALAAIDRAYEAGAGDVVLIDGVTGSGKTEVYLSAIEKVVAHGKTACVLVPEISLTAQTVGRFRSRFGEAVAVFHSRLSAGERLDQWDMVGEGRARVVVGARSALFCPMRNLGLIIIDEEHEQSYKQRSSPRYHARELAAKLAQLSGCPLVLGSATPSAEAMARSAQGEFGGVSWQRTQMLERPSGAVLPRVRIVDLRREFARGGRSIFSGALRQALLDVADRKEKAIILHNRRGFAPFLLCRECGCVPTCRHCSTALTYHEHNHSLVCHTCGETFRVRPYPAPGSACPRCKSRYLAKMGLGTQQVEHALRELLPADVEIIRMDADTTRGKDGHRRVLEAFDDAHTAVLLGTQMIAKGLDFPEVTMVGVINADYSLHMPDFRAQERTFDLLEQVAGRAGRAGGSSEVIIQTYRPDDPVIRAVAAHDRELYSEPDLAQRKEARYPPYVRLANIVAQARNPRAARACLERYMAILCRELAHTSAALAPKPGGEVEILGPNPCAIERAHDLYRYHILVKFPLTAPVPQALSRSAALSAPDRSVRLTVDVDAYDLM
ncbi:primosomal protein N' [Collinsella sp. AGMB00827]|uniref:Replication restart protein PriA n=1 Tax=Collinsella ureilytica TaxID=2869515 RepID=A0ABS7MIH9_9ACTN|nr:primosomal protein N' [Collinsella urealyticum]MBY4796838.1 primosomal protein N' [Collinsella urealyticum]